MTEIKITPMLRVYISQTQAWISRRAAKGIPVNADEIWAYIKTRWPNMEESRQEYLFQKSHEN